MTCSNRSLHITAVIVLCLLLQSASAAPPAAPDPGLKPGLPWAQFHKPNFTSPAETGLDPQVLSLTGGGVVAKGERISLTIAGIAARAHERDLPMHGEGYYAMEYPEELPEDAYSYAQNVLCYGAQIAKVLVDIETGEITVEDFVAVHDVGRAINPAGVRGQIEGGVTQGLGYALMEELVVEEGQTQNLSLESYLIPTAKDVPMIRTSLVEIPEPYAPLGAKGVGEPPLNPAAPAIANAVSDAIGMPMDNLPLTPERVLEAIEQARDSGADP